MCCCLVSRPIMARPLIYGTWYITSQPLGNMTCYPSLDPPCNWNELNCRAAGTKITISLGSAAWFCTGSLFDEVINQNLTLKVHLTLNMKCGLYIISNVYNFNLLLTCEPIWIPSWRNLNLLTTLNAKKRPQRANHSTFNCNCWHYHDTRISELWAVRSERWYMKLLVNIVFQ